MDTVNPKTLMKEVEKDTNRKIYLIFTDWKINIIKMSISPKAPNEIFINIPMMFLVVVVELLCN